MKILVLSNSIPGFLSFRKELAEALTHRGDVIYISGPESPMFKELEELGCIEIKTNVDRRGINPMKDLLLLIQYYRIMAKYKPDVVLGYTIKPNIYGGLASRISRVPFIANITGLGTAAESPGILQKVIIAMYNVATKRMKCIFFQNEANKFFFEKNHIATNVKQELIPGSGVNLEKFPLMPYPDNKIIEFIYVSRIMREKGIDDYLYLAKYMKNKYGDRLIFHVVGICEDLKYKTILENLASREIIKYHGYQKDVRPFIAQSYCLIHPSFYPEGMSNVLLEAEAMGRPVITTLRPGCRETVEAGVTGFLFEEENKEQLIERVEEFLLLPQEEKEKMGKLARKRVEKIFDRKIVINKYLEVIDLE